MREVAIEWRDALRIVEIALEDLQKRVNDNKRVEDLEREVQFLRQTNAHNEVQIKQTRFEISSLRNLVTSNGQQLRDLQVSQFTFS